MDRERKITMEDENTYEEDVEIDAEEDDEEEDADEHLSVAQRLEKYAERKKRFMADDLFRDLRVTLEPMKQEFASEINNMLKSFRLTIYHSGDSTSPYYQYNAADEAAKFTGLKMEHMHVLQEIRLMKSKGILKKELKKKTNIPQAQLTRILKALENRQLIQAVKSIANKTMSVYMEYGLEPAREHTGGPWYTDQEFDEFLVQQVSELCLRRIQKRFEEGSRGVSIQDILSIVQSEKGRQALNVNLTDRDLENIFNALKYDQKIQPVPNQNPDARFDKILYQPCSTATDMNYLAQVPCGICPVRDQCVPGGYISPTNCEYMNTMFHSHGLEF